MAHGPWSNLAHMFRILLTACVCVCGVLLSAENAPATTPPPDGAVRPEFGPSVGKLKAMGAVTMTTMALEIYTLEARPSWRGPVGVLGISVGTTALMVGALSATGNHDPDAGPWRAGLLLSGTTCTIMGFAVMRSPSVDRPRAMRMWIAPDIRGGAQVRMCLDL